MDNGDTFYRKVELEAARKGISFSERMDELKKEGKITYIKKVLPFDEVVKTMTEDFNKILKGGRKS